MAESAPNNPEKLIPKIEKEGLFSGIMNNIRKVTNRVRRSISNVFEWTKKTTKGTIELLFPETKEIEKFLMGKKEEESKEEPPSPAAIVAAKAASEVASTTA